jgi:hypothetical protein
MRSALVFLVLLLSACEGSFVTVSDVGRKAKIEKSFAARDACLAKNAAADVTSDADAATIARAVALACAPETEKLVDATNRDGDTQVAASIRQNSEFRAMKYVMKARGQAIF